LLAQTHRLMRRIIDEMELGRHRDDRGLVESLDGALRIANDVPMELSRPMHFAKLDVCIGMVCARNVRAKSLDPGDKGGEMGGSAIVGVNTFHELTLEFQPEASVIALTGRQSK
jgi:hypothetical protein